MITEIKNVEDLESVVGGVSIVRSGTSSSSTSSSGPSTRTNRSFDSAFDRFLARRDAARARNAQRDEERAAREDSGSTRRGFAPSAALGLP